MKSDWRTDLDDYFAKLDNDENQGSETTAQENARDEAFFASVAVPALEELKAELEKHGRQVTVGSSTHHASMKVVYRDDVEFDYAIHARRLKIYPVKTSIEGGSNFNAEGSLRSDSQDFTVRDITKTELIQHCLKEYKDSRLKVAWGTRRQERK